MLVNVTKHGDSLSVVLPQDIVTQLNIEEGDTLYLTKTSNGYEISALNPEFAKKMEIARRGIQQYRNALIDLAQ